MAVVRNLMIRIGADYSPAKRAMDGATRELNKFRQSTERATRQIRSQRGLGGVSTEFRNLGRELSTSISRLRGARGVGGLVSELKNIVPVAGRSAKALTGVGESAAGLAARLGPAGIAIGAIVASLGALVGIAAKASQEAIKFEAAVQRLNFQLGSGSRQFMDWARAQGLASQTAAEMGATYSVLLSSFISDTGELTEQVRQLVQTTRVVASHTGRSIEDVLERMRSGLLGNTEAIEDLGIFVNVSMIESTNAFRRFAGDRSWEQLDFRLQQQIRLAAILEQAYARYGDKLQDNTLTRQEQLLEQLKQIRLNLSLAFKPIYDSVLPALTRMAEKIAQVTENIARFMHQLFGLDFDEATRGATDNADAIDQTGQSYDDLADSVKKARNELASFDELNLIGERGAGGGGGTGGAGGPSLPAIPQEPIKIGFEWDIPDPPQIPAIQIPPPQPPDAGMGAVATTVNSTVDQMAAENRARWVNFWRDISADTMSWSQVIQNAIGSMMMAVSSATGQHTTMAALAWRTMLQGMTADLNTHRPSLESGWQALLTKLSSIKNTLADVRDNFKNTLNFMLRQIEAYRPFMEWEWHLIAAAVRKPINPLNDLKAAWSSALNEMQMNLSSAVSNMIGWLGNLISEFQRARAEAARPIQSSAPAQASKPATSPAPATTPTHLYDLARQSALGRAPTTAADDVPKETFVNQLMSTLSYTFSGENLQRIYEFILAEANKPQNKTGLQLYTSLMGAGGLARFGAAAVGQAKSVWEALRGVAAAVPSFATGGVVFGPTLAMIGDNPGARFDPEIAAPQSYIEEAVSAGNADLLRALERIEQAVRDLRYIQAVISEGEVGRASVNYIRTETRRGRNPLKGV